MSERVQIPGKPPAAPAQTLKPASIGVLRRKCACGGSGGSGGDCADCKKKKLQRRAAGQGPEVAPPIVHDVLRSPGQPLDGATRSYFEPRFQHDFSNVQVHADARASESARSVNALAYTVGSQIAFADGHYQPGTERGQKLLAHELTHVVQQGGQSGESSSLRVGPADDAHEREAEVSASATSHRGLITVQRAPMLLRRQAGTSSSGDPASGGTKASSASGSTSDTVTPEVCAAPSDMGCNPSTESIKAPGYNFVFPVNSADLDQARPTTSKSASAKTDTDAAADAWKKAGSSGKIRVDGYASAEYQCVYNWRLSCRRAQAVADELKMQGVPEGNIALNAHGESSEAGSSLGPNRRATISLPAAPVPPPKPEPKPEPKPMPEDTNKCGPDITSALTATLGNVETFFRGLSGWQKRRSCMALTGDAPLAGVNPIMAWDTRELFLPNTYWLDPYFHSGGCGSPRDPGCEMDAARHLCETSGTCGNTVLVGGKCMLAGTANYAVYGKMFRMCVDEFFYYFGFQMRNLIRLYKLVDWDDSGPPIAMANAGFNGTLPTVSSDAENRGSCTGRCASARAGAFDFIWEPYKSR